MFSLGIVGNGFVGNATSHFAGTNTQVKMFDADPGKCRPHGTHLEDLLSCDLVMICVPTPMSSDGSCSTHIVESVIRQLRSTHHAPPIIVRSTVPVGFCEAHNVGFMPEFLTENNFLEDFRQNPLWVVGADHDETRQLAKTLLHLAHTDGNILSGDAVFTTTKEAEAIKYFRNCFLATKVGFCNEFYHLCQQHGMSFDVVSSVATRDARIGPSHSQVPGHDGRFGFGGTCFPKDISSLISQFQSLGIPCPILSSVNKRNLEIDRSSHDWEQLVGRAVCATEHEHYSTTER